jgi:hypothetical protein
MTDYTQNVWCGNFSNVIAFFIVNALPYRVQQGDLGGNAYVLLCFDKFDNSILSMHFVVGVNFMG